MIPYGNPMGQALYSGNYEAKPAKYVFFQDTTQDYGGNVLNGGTISNPKKMGGYAYTGDLVQYSIPTGVAGNATILWAYRVKATATATATAIVVEGNGFSHKPEVGEIIMKEVADVTKTSASGKITDVTYDADKMEYTITVDTALGALAVGDVLCQAAGVAASATAKPLVTSVNTYLRRDMPFPVAGSGTDLNIVAQTVDLGYSHHIFIARMSPIPKHILALNNANVEGLFKVKF